jgi:hypothetical protein
MLVSYRGSKGVNKDMLARLLLLFTLSTVHAKTPFKADECEQQSCLLQSPKTTIFSSDTADTNFPIDTPEKVTFITPGLVKGTLIALANGSAKPIELVRYDDKLLVWNFDDGKLDEALPLFIQRPVAATEYTTLTFSDASDLRIIGDYRCFCEGAGSFVPMSREGTHLDSTTAFTRNGNQITLQRRENLVNEEPTEFYNVITSRHFNVFANGILVSTRLNVDLYTVKNMRFNRLNATAVRTTKEAHPTLSDATFKALRLSEQTFDPHEAAEFVTKFAQLQLPRPRPSSRPQGHPVGGEGSCPLPHGLP